MLMPEPQSLCHSTELATATQDSQSRRVNADVPKAFTIWESLSEHDQVSDYPPVCSRNMISSIREGSVA
jgi:hypothetical protein